MATKRVKLGILRALHDPTVPKISDAACLALLWQSPNGEAVLDYWSDVTDGYLDFTDSQMFPWVDITFDATGTSRSVQLQKAYDATKALPGSVMDGFDGWIVLTLPGTVTNAAGAVVGIDGGAAGVAGKGGCALPVMSSDHTFMCHEFGHVLGFRHSYGVVNNGVEWDQMPPWDEGVVYGDPYDIMSSASFGQRNRDPAVVRWWSNPVFAGTAVPGWPGPAANSLGCEPARAHVHQWDPAALPPGTVRVITPPPPGGATRLSLVAAGRHSRTTSLLVIKAPGEDAEGRGRTYVEYRESTGWDRGLDTSGTDLARQAVVVHTLADTTNDGVRCWYRGQIIVPLETDTDVAVEGTPYVVSVTDVDLAAGRVEVSVALSAERRVDLDRTVEETLVSASNPRPMGTPCGQRIVMADRTWSTRATYVGHTSGYAGTGQPGVVSPVLTWTVGGTTVAPGSGTVPVTTSAGVASTATCSLAATGVLVLESRAGEAYSVPVVCTATEVGGGSPTSASHVFDPVGATSGFTPHDLRMLDDCMSERFQEVPSWPRDWLVDPEPDPLRYGLRDRVNEARLRRMTELVRGIDPRVAEDIARAIELRYGSVR